MHVVFLFCIFMAKPTVMFQVVQEKDTKLDTRGVLFETDFYLEKDRKNIQMKEGLLFIAASKWAVNDCISIQTLVSSTNCADKATIPTR